MFTLTHEKSGTTVTTPDINVCKRIAFTILETIGEDKGWIAISDGQKTIYMNGKYGIDDSVFDKMIS